MNREARKSRQAVCQETVRYNRGEKRNSLNASNDALALSMAKATSPRKCRRESALPRGSVPTRSRVQGSEA